MLAAVAFAGSALGGEPQVFPIEFDLSWETCSQLRPGTMIHGDGIAQFSARSSATFHAVINGTATTAPATPGASTTPRTGVPVDLQGNAQLTDHFNLTGNAGVLHLHSHFVGIFSSWATSSETQAAHGDPIGCDPI